MSTKCQISAKSFYSKTSDEKRYLDDLLGELRPPAQKAVQAVPLLLQGSQVALQPGLRLLVPHGEELPADLQSVDEAALVPLEHLLRVLRGGGTDESQWEAMTSGALLILHNQCKAFLFMVIKSAEKKHSSSSSCDVNVINRSLSS